MISKYPFEKRTFLKGGGGRRIDANEYLKTKELNSVHYIFEVTVKDGYSVEAYAEGWIAASHYIQKAPGARGTRLHRKIGDPTTVLAIATWDSKASRDAMEVNPPEEIEAIINAQLPFVDIRFLGEFDAPDWVVLPPNYDGAGLAHLDQD